jgi:hypothetical protein
MLLAVLAGLALQWEGRAVVHAGDRTIPIRVRTSIAADGTATSESWPEELGEAKGLRRMIIGPAGGELHRGGTVAPLPAAMVTEERAQFGIYRQVQEAAARVPALTAAGADTVSIPGHTTSWFTMRSGSLRSAVNWLPLGEGGRPVRQDFSFDGWWRSGGAIFPRHMILTRDGKPYFELWVERFEAR